MKGLTKYGAVATKIRAMRAKLLSAEEYSRLASAASPKEIALYLKELPGYRIALDSLDIDSFRRSVLEGLLIRSVITDIKKIFLYLDDKQKTFLEMYGSHYEIRLLNNVMRGLFNKYSDASNREYEKFPLTKNAGFSQDDIMRAQNMDEFLYALKASRYFAPLNSIRKKFENPSLFDYEMSLDMFYFNQVWDAAKTLPRSDRTVMLNLHGTEMDMLNILWIYRTKAYYHVPLNYISNYVIPITLNLKRSEITEMINAPDKESLMGIIFDTYYGKFIDPKDPSSLERMYMENLVHDHDEARKKYPYSFAVVEAYLFDKRCEIENIISIAESVRYGYAAASILGNLNIGGGRR